MKWHLLFVCLALGALLVGCGSGGRQLPPQKPVAPLPTTPKAAMEKADEAVAALEAAVAGSDIEKVRKAVMGMNTGLAGVVSLLAEADQQAANDARKAGKPIPPRKADALAPAFDAIATAHSAILPPPKNDIAKVKEAIPIIKSALDAVRDAAQ